MCRESDGHDSGHELRAARFALTIRARHIDLGEEEFTLLMTAMEGHTAGRRHEDVTVSTCWDADRLDLARVAITPDAGRLCTAAARDPETILRASKNATDWVERYYDRLPSSWSDQP